MGAVLWYGKPQWNLFFITACRIHSYCNQYYQSRLQTKESHRYCICRNQPAIIMPLFHLVHNSWSLSQRHMFHKGSNCA